jgi:predicted CXXCH cytochrome family protein
MKTCFNNTENKLFPWIVLLAFLSIAFSPVASLSIEDSLHLDKNKLPKGCGSCHKGHGMSNTPMLPQGRDVFCYRCHGVGSTFQDPKDKVYIAGGVTLPDIRKEFNKPYRHPVEITGIHKNGEILPETDRSAQRHAECADCHNHHYVTRENKSVNIKGVSSQGLTVQNITSEYELCFKCHSSSANLPADQRNKREQFNSSNPSYHPVISQGRNRAVPSLLYPLNASSLIKCTDCHNNDDSLGPNGPHGSNYEHILKKNFTLSEGSEGPYQYELCYSCHRRESILANESFYYHDLHISVVNASCRTCHNPHGSTQYSHLIEFDLMVVSPSSKGYTGFNDLGNKAGECYLTCHGKDHSPISYPTSQSLKSSSSRSSR